MNPHLLDQHIHARQTEVMRAVQASRLAQRVRQTPADRQPRWAWLWAWVRRPAPAITPAGAGLRRTTERA
ncbi:MAG: hypothetical protein MUC99_12380 [Anaerolineae bacterium]|nr:hypothetical protein [Anaerolineae bacterium]